MVELGYVPLKMIWWNTSLSPPAGESRGSPATWDAATGEIAKLRSVLGWDVLGLAEVNDSDVGGILDRLGSDDLSAVGMGQRRKKLVNDLSLIYDRRRLTLLDGRSLNADYGGVSLRVGHRASFETNTGQLLHIVVSHWPSRLRSAESVPFRTHLGNALYRSLEGFLKRQQHVVVMGDFNDDPHSPSMTDHFLGTRDRALAIERGNLFYNPFWRHLGESTDHGDGTGGVCGTYYYRSGVRTRWHTFDQILVSPSMLRSTDAVLFEPMSRIVGSEDLISALQDAASIFDHLPVSSHIFLKVSHD